MRKAPAAPAPAPPAPPPVPPPNATFVMPPTFLAVEREAAAASAGVDVGTFSMLMDLQHRDITPEDYDLLGRARAPAPGAAHATEQTQDAQAPLGPLSRDPLVCVFVEPTLSLLLWSQPTSLVPAHMTTCHMCMRTYVLPQVTPSRP